MKRILTILTLVVLAVLMMGMDDCADSQETRDAQMVSSQQALFAINQPPPKSDWSLERDLAIQVYKIRNMQVSTYTVWRGDTSVIEGHCPSIGFGMPYDTSLTNPLVATDEDIEGMDKNSLTTIEQAEPNGLYSSKNTNATWVFCIIDDKIAPHYVETKVTGYPYFVEVDMEKNLVTRVSAPEITMTMGKQE